MSIKAEILAIKASSPDGMFHVESGHDWAVAHPESDLHRALEWNDATAGYQWRLSQIRQLVRLHVVNDDGAPQLVSLSFDRSKAGGYRDLSDVLGDRTLTDVLLRDALDDLERVRKKYETVTELARVWEAAAVVQTKSRSRRRRVPAQSGQQPAA